jgi:hypothetical protein
MACPKIKQPPGFSKKITNDTCVKQINQLGTFVKILLGFLTECNVTLIRGMVTVVLRHHVA